MDGKYLTDTDRDLINQARQLIKERAVSGKHAVSCAMRSVSGNVYLGLHIEAYVGRAAVCAESVALGIAAIADDLDIDTIVAVYKTGEVVSPCGICRELISDYSPESSVILSNDNELKKVSIGLLLPEKYKRDYSGA